MEDVGLPAQLGGQRHHAVFAQRIDRRVGDLGEGLAEVVVQRPVAPAQYRHRGVVTHRTSGFLLGLGHRPQHQFHFLGAELEQLVVAAQGLLVERLLGQRGVDQFGLQVGQALLQPLLVGRAAAVDPVHRLRIEQVAALEVDGDHLARTELALAHDALGRHLPHPGLAGDDEVAIGGQQPARGPQAVAVQGAGRIARIQRHDPGRAIPRLGVEAVELVERSQVRVLELQRLGRRRHQDAQRLDQFHAAGHQQLEHVVQALRIGAMQGHDRLQFGHVEARALPHLATGLGPAAVAFDGVDLAVVGQHPERMGQRPARQGVGGKTLVEHHRAGGQVRALQVGVEARQLVRQDHALVADRMRRQRHHVVVGASFTGAGAQALLAAAPGQEQGQRERLLLLPAAGLHEQLFDHRQGVACQRAAHAGIDRHRAPALHRHPDPVQFVFQGVAALGSGGLVVRQEHQARSQPRIGVQADAGVLGQRPQPGSRLPQQQAAAVAGQSVGGHAAAVGHARERGDRRVHQRPRGLVVELGDHAEATGVAFGGRVVEPVAVAGGHLRLEDRACGLPIPERGGGRHRTWFLAKPARPESRRNPD